MALQVLSATTATPLEIWTTLFTPATAFDRAASKLLTLPPNTGQRATTAYTIPGSRTSMLNCALPSTLGGVSKRFTGLPMRRNCAASFKVGLVGGVSWDAASARLP